MYRGSLAPEGGRGLPGLGGGRSGVAGWAVLGLPDSRAKDTRLSGTDATWRWGGVCTGGGGSRENAIPGLVTRGGDKQQLVLCTSNWLHQRHHHETPKHQQPTTQCVVGYTNTALKLVQIPTHDSG